MTRWLQHGMLACTTLTAIEVEVRASTADDGSGAQY